MLTGPTPCFLWCDDPTVWTARYKKQIDGCSLSEFAHAGNMI